MKTIFSPFFCLYSTDIKPNNRIFALLCAIKKKKMEKLNEYHRKTNARKMKSVAYWTKHPLSREECLNQFKRLREQRLSRESK